MHFQNEDTSLLNMERNRVNLYDQCLMVLVDRNDMKFTSSTRKMERDPKSKKMKKRSNLKQLYQMRGNRVGKMVQDRSGNCVLIQIYDSFWSYKRPGQRTKFIYESRKNYGRDGYTFKISVADDPSSGANFCGTDQDELIEKLKEEYPESASSERLLLDKRR